MGQPRRYSTALRTEQTALTPDLPDRLVVRRGWGWDRFEGWLGTAMADALLGPSG